MARLFTAALVAADRARPEDAALVFWSGPMLVFVVADGAGGRSGGARAADLVAARVVTEVAANPGTPPDWVSLLRRIDEEVLTDEAAGESTAVIGAVVGDQVTGASVGDSEAWLIGDSELTVLTAMQDRLRLGTGCAAPTEFAASLGSALLLAASDGLFNPASAESICATARANESAEAFVDLARGQSGRLYDDVGLVVIRR